MNKTRVLICGASGFIGYNLFEHFNSTEGYETYGTYLSRPLDCPRVARADMRKREDALRFTKSMDIVINAAAMTDGIGVFSDAEKAKSYTQTNDVINASMIEAANINKVKHYIFLSCTVMYPSSLTPLKEQEYDLGRVHEKYLLFAKMKLFGEDLCRDLANLGRTKYTAIRHTNIYGPYDKFDLKRGHVLAATVKKVMDAQDEIEIWGTGEESRDFLYIEDLIAFIERSTKFQESYFEIFNAGLGHAYTINQLAEMIIHHSGKKLKIKHNIDKPSIPTHMKVDVNKARELLGWKARINLYEGLWKTMRWYKHQNPL